VRKVPGRHRNRVPTDACDEHGGAKQTRVAIRRKHIRRGEKIPPEPGTGDGLNLRSEPLRATKSPTPACC
jgi:hypothetical protein